jgi:hypothetical protein
VGAYADLCTEFASRPGVTLPGSGTGFGSRALKVGRSIFAMEYDDALVVKLPAARVRELIDSGVGVPFDGGKGKPMKEWLTVSDPAHWSAVAEEAYSFVASR